MRAVGLRLSGAGRIDLGKLGFSAADVAKLEHLKQTLATQRALTTGEEYKFLMESAARVSEALGEGPLTDAIGVRDRFSPARIKEVTERMKAAVRPLPAWSRLTLAFPEFAVEPAMTKDVLTLLELMEMLVASVVATAPPIEQDHLEGGEGGPKGLDFGEGHRSVLPGRVLRIARPSEYPLKPRKSDVDDEEEQKENRKRDAEDARKPWRTLLRPVAAELIEKLKRREAKNFVGSKPVLLDGPKGGGKSETLAQTAAWARNNGWLVLWLNGEEMTRGGRLLRSRNEPTLFDQPTTSRTILARFAASEGEKLATLPVRIDRGVTWPRPPATPPATLRDVAAIGEKTEDNAGPALAWLTAELALVTQYPVLVAIDNVGSLHVPSNYYDMDSERFAVEQLCPSLLTIPRLFRDPSRLFLLRGTVVAALSREGGRPAKPFERFWRDVGGAAAVPVPPLSLGEFETLYLEQARSGEVRHASSATRRYLYALTAGNTRELREVSYYL